MQSATRALNVPWLLPRSLSAQNGWRIEEEGLAALAALSTLRMLNLKGCRSISDLGVAALQPLTGLQHLSLQVRDNVNPKPFARAGGSAVSVQKAATCLSVCLAGWPSRKRPPVCLSVWLAAPSVRPSIRTGAWLPPWVQPGDVYSLASIQPAMSVYPSAQAPGSHPLRVCSVAGRP
jgi:hypothetical protein